MKTTNIENKKQTFQKSKDKQAESDNTSTHWITLVFPRKPSPVSLFIACSISEYKLHIEVLDVILLTDSKESGRCWAVRFWRTSCRGWCWSSRPAGRWWTWLPGVSLRGWWPWSWWSWPWLASRWCSGCSLTLDKENTRFSSTRTRRVLCRPTSFPHFSESHLPRIRSCTAMVSSTIVDLSDICKVIERLSCFLIWCHRRRTLLLVCTHSWRLRF